MKKKAEIWHTLHSSDIQNSAQLIKQEILINASHNSYTGPLPKEEIQFPPVPGIDI